MNKISLMGKNLLLFLLSVFMLLVRPLLGPRGVCRFTPTCSEYAIEAIRVHGSLKGTVLSIYRVLRCNPLCRGGYDPVPEKRQKNRK